MRFGALGGSRHEFGLVCLLLALGALGLLLAYPSAARGSGGDTSVIAWGSRGSGDGQFETPVRLHAAREGGVWVVDQSLRRAQLFAEDSTLLRVIPLPSPGSAGSEPRDLAVGPDGSLYVTFLNARVGKYSGTGELLLSWGGQGTGPGLFDGLVTLDVDGDGFVYVADSGGRRVQEFNGDGSLRSVWPLAEHTVGGPVDVIASLPGFVIVLTHDDAGKILVLSTDGELITWWALPRAPGILYYARAGGVGPDGQLYVTTNWNEVLRFDLSGSRTGRWGGWLAPGIKADWPVGIAVNANGFVFASQTFPIRIVRFHESLVPVHPTSWGGIKRGFAGR